MTWEYIILAIVWLCVSTLCINCVNEQYNTKTEWEKTPIYWKAWYVLITPLIYLALGGYKAFKK